MTTAEATRLRAKLAELSALIDEIEEPVAAPPLSLPSPVRISDALEIGVTFVSPEYSSVSPWNLNGTRLLLVAQDHFMLYDGSGIFLLDLPQIGASSRPRWSRRDPRFLSYIVGNKLMALELPVMGGDLSYKAFEIHTFSENQSIDDRGEADSGPEDARVLVGGNEMFVFRPDDKSIVNARRFSDPFDSVMLTPDGNLLVSWLQAGIMKYQGIELYNADMNLLRQVARANGHKAVCRDVNGDEILVWTNSNDSAPISNAQNAIVKVRLSDGKQTPLLELDWSLAVHVSCPDQAGFCVVSTYQPGDPKPCKYANEILRVALDGSGARTLAEHGSRPFPNNAYQWQPRASVSRDGRKLVYASNLGKAGADYCDAYLLSIGQGLK